MDDRQLERALAKQQREASKANNSAQVSEQCGSPVISHRFGSSYITIYQKGYVQVKGMFGLATSPPEKLVAIQYSADVQKKTGLGRAAGAVLTNGLNLFVSPNRRGDIYLTIVTETATHPLKVDPPTASDMASAQALEAAGNAVLEALARESQSRKKVAKKPKTSEKTEKSPKKSDDLADQLSQLAKLHQKGVLTDQEFASAKKKLLG
jgi:Short C-terminal domain